MNKILTHTKRIFVLMLSLFVVITLVGCTSEDVVKHKIEFDTNGGSIIKPTFVTDGAKLEKPADPIYDENIFLGWYTTKDFKEEYNFDSVVRNEFTLYAKWDIKDVIVTEIAGVNLPSNIVDFNTAKQGSENKRTEFMDLTKTFIVGDDNNWVFKPMTTFIEHNVTKDTYKPTTVGTWEYEIHVFLLNKDSETEIELTNKEYIDSYNNVECTIDFGTKAIGEEFRVEVFPTKLTEEQTNENNLNSTYTIQTVVKIVDGFNVYNALDLAYINNGGAEYKYWEEFKQVKGLDYEKEINSFIFQNDIVIKNEDMPAYMFLDESVVKPGHADYDRALGSLRDSVDIYHHDLKDGEEFNLYGNYFNLDCSAIKEVVRERNANNISAKDEPIFSHANLFKFAGSENGHVLVDSLNVIGNAPKVEDTVKSGGVIIFKSQYVRFDIYNVIATRCFISYYTEYSKSVQVVEKCKAYDAFNTFVYNFGSNNFTIKDCEMIGAGGPCIIQDHVDAGKPSEKISNTTILNSKLESYVAGTEGWFALTKATALVGPIINLDMAFNPFNRSYLTRKNDIPFFNFVLVNKSSTSQSATSVFSEGTATIDDHTFNYGKNNPVLRAVVEATFGKAPTFETSSTTATSGIGYFNGKFIADPANNQIVDPNNMLFSGDYLCIYQSGMAIILGYHAL